MKNIDVYEASHSEFSVAIEYIDMGVCVLRGGRHFRFGSNFSISAIIIFRDSSTVEVFAYIGEYNRDIRRAIRKCLEMMGVDKVIYERVKSGKFIPHKKS